MAKAQHGGLASVLLLTDAKAADLEVDLEAEALGEGQVLVTL